MNDLLRSTANLLRRALPMFFCATLTLACLWFFDGSTPLDWMHYDATQKMAQRQPPSDIVIIAIDDDSMHMLGRWPWSRSTHAQLIRRLADEQTRVIGLNILFPHPQNDITQADEVLADAISYAGNVVLPFAFEHTNSSQEIQTSLPNQALASAAAALGHIHIEISPDGVARSYKPYQSDSSVQWPHFIHAMEQVAMQQTPNVLMQPKFPQLHSAAPTQTIQYYSLQQSFQTLSYSEVLQGHYPEAFFKDKWVLIGTTASGLSASVASPSSTTGKLMPSIVFLANALASSQHQTLLRKWTTPLTWGLNLLISIVPWLWFGRVRVHWALWVHVGATLLVLLSSSWLMIYAQVLMPVTSGLLGLLAAYPLWATMRLERLRVLLSQEVQRLHLELAKGIGKPLHEAHTQNAHATYEFQIEQIHQAQEQLQQLEQDRLDTLNFLSHDMRVPLTNTRNLLQNELPPHHPALRQLQDTLSWTEQFLQLIRAKTLHLQPFEALWLGDQLHQTLDDMTAQANLKNVRFVRSIWQAPLYVHAQPETLQRVWQNLLSNAIAHTPENSIIEVTLAPLGDTQLRVSITDQGPGVPQAFREKIFERYVQANGRSSGVGLGLYFVKLTVNKHGGHVYLQDKLHPPGAQFVVDLPTLNAN